MSWESGAGIKEIHSGEGFKYLDLEIDMLKKNLEKADVFLKD